MMSGFLVGCFELMMFLSSGGSLERHLHQAWTGIGIGMATALVALWAGRRVGARARGAALGGRRLLDLVLVRLGDVPPGALEVTEATKGRRVRVSQSRLSL